jgi:hypothetical protein
MVFKEWTILLVDDEPDVLAISKLAMKGFDVYGLPLKITRLPAKPMRSDCSTTMPRLHVHWRSRF